MLFAIADAVLTVLAFQLAYFTRTQLTLERIFYLQPQTHILLLLFCVFVWVFAGSLQRVYEYLDSARGWRIIENTFRQSVVGIIAIILFQYLLRLDPPLSRSFLAVLFLYNMVLLSAFRWASPQLVGAMHRGFGSPYHLVIVGDGPKARRLANHLIEGSPFRIEIAATVSEADCKERLPRLLDQGVVDEVIFDVDSSKLPELEEVFLLCDEEGVRTRVAVDFFPHVNSDVTLDRVGDAPLLTFSAAPMDDLRLYLKRVFDFAAALAALVLLSPMFLVIALLVNLSSKGPVIYRQVRCGLNGRKFVFYKFRSMVEDADSMKAGLEHLSHRDIAFKIADDPRVTPVGRFIRKFSLDELPQLYNVLRGDMSIVGPRPPLPQEVDRYERWQRRRLRMRPGLTCLWAVSGRDHIDFNTWMRLDISYIENWSLKLDWSIILRTIPHVLAGKGAH
ncbi:MAG TPA: sugar transferase [Bryobacteraceae bacterium]|nr:sugar transferase [Bryobacteraceae bacterium]